MSYVGGVVGELPILVRGGLGDSYGSSGHHLCEGELPVHVVPDPGLGFPDSVSALLAAGLWVGSDPAWTDLGQQDLPPRLPVKLILLSSEEWSSPQQTLNLHLC